MTTLTLHLSSTPSRSHLGPMAPNHPETRTCISYSATFDSLSHVPGILIDEKSYREKTGKTRNLEDYISKSWRYRRLENFIDDIERHVENRIQLFIHQLFLCYKSNLVFLNETNAAHQVGLSVHLDNCYQAAHSGTLPTLRIDPCEHGVSRVLFGDNEKVRDLWNTTVLLPRAVNECDSAIDKSRAGGNRGMSFRTYCVDLLNSVSKGEKNPREALVCFLNRIEIILNKMKSDGKNKNNDSSLILEAYEHVLHRYQSESRSCLDLFKQIFFKFRSRLSEEDFYLAIRDEIREGIEYDESASAAHPEPIRTLSSSFDVLKTHACIEKSLDDWISANGVRARKTAEQYIAQSIFDFEIINRATDYLNFLHTLDRKGRKGELDDLNNEHFSSRSIRKLWNSIGSVINVGARDKPYILLRVLLELLEPLARQKRAIKPIRDTRITLSFDHLSMIRELIRKKLLPDAKDSETVLPGTKTQINYSQVCVKDRQVCKCAELFFWNIVYCSGENLRLGIIAVMLDIKTENTLSSQLSKELRDFFFACLNAIRTSENDSKKNPQKMGHILALTVDKICQKLQTR